MIEIKKLSTTQLAKTWGIVGIRLDKMRAERLVNHRAG